MRTAGDAASVASSARAAIRELDADLALYGVRTMEESSERSLAQRRLYSWLIGVFAAMAVVLALAGAAKWLPARRAARLDPMRSLRTEERGGPDPVV